jgi:predicted RNA-binding protein
VLSKQKKRETMCESTVYDTKGTKLMDDVIHMKIYGDRIEMVDILNQGMTVEGKIVELDLEKHSIFIEVDEKGLIQ